MGPFTPSPPSDIVVGRSSEQWLQEALPTGWSCRPLWWTKGAALWTRRPSRTQPPTSIPWASAITAQLPASLSQALGSTGDMALTSHL